MTARLRLRIDVHGVVQGVGFRPFVYTTAAAMGLTGHVRNDSSGAIIEIEGDEGDLERFLQRLHDGPPPLAVIESVEVRRITTVGGTGFRITDTSRADGGRTLVSPDVAMCRDCAAEQRDPANRRHRHAFINCTNCGPRFTIIASLPYDRASTTMAGFPMCTECAREYRDPDDRRFHAQPVCCPNCGPTLRLLTTEGEHATGEHALQRARQLLATGGIVAVKGIGGYHLACDAANRVSVAELRHRKRRGDKPFAVMVAELATARAVAEVGDVAARLLCGPQRPIVLIPRRSETLVCPEVSPHNPDLGVMLAYSPLHALLFGLPGDPPGPAALVMTSANLSGEPICFADDDALQRLSGLADAWLTHDRAILVPCDDSVVRVVDDDEVSEMAIRRSRGYAPLPVALPVPVVPTLAVGADLKNTVAVGDHEYAWLSGYIGDMDDLAALSAFDRAVTHLQALTGTTPRMLAADAHPGYRSTAWAHRNAGGRPVRSVQHHHAHIAAVMAEHGLDGSARVLGIAFDGTGFGSDGAVWGGEVLLADYKGFERIAHLAYVPLAGGDVSVRRPYRMALSHLWAAGIPWDADLPPVRACPEGERRALCGQLNTGTGCVPTSSMGRLFDAVSALIGVRQTVDYEAQAAIELEGQARHTPTGATAYAFAMYTDRRPVTFDAAPVLAAVIADLRAHVPPAVISARFHQAVADLVVDLARLAAGGPVALTGGVFQNALLLRLTLAGLRDSGIHALTACRVPPNDGGLALGQLLVGNAG
ncbi:carbamoyltransferase HypF [Mycolicibacterium smegmatis]|uniref:carbamoyltransferase HypF n=1 Tax=Mycolicibacterium smegmatis TaxID=1772 RepID=UPI0005D9A01C|nr:carbamoyltransferase HypF [Mycolicibacterium smegmatis]MDF1903436.1 carbamoyltransferase HypF [Mycolicibacterium smegmatis]MDF1909946.1 carbamoyltransferase HypF [Mycolicibacterium smegmatis]MDF1921852.1 carbamoyltransferase HypF [Mycolicibacterium smegmatis]MDF1928348.1 carbamoyltransferase HypF [Mycolicibacterium smegmatis]UAK54726.1 carbamoyltransferase HypF [Mycolicibacterium smegmatis]